MEKIEHLVIHCTDTPPNMAVTADMLKQWHMAPRDNKDSNGKVNGVHYMNKNYPDRDHLPKDILNGVPIKNLHGRGWDRVGYSDMIQQSGKLINLVPYDNDFWVEAGEITYGAINFNRNSKHIVLVGGWLTHETRHGIFDFLQIFNVEMEKILIQYIGKLLHLWPWITILGHNQVSNKTCPNFSVPKFLKLHKIPEQNIYKQD